MYVYLSKILPIFVMPISLVLLFALVAAGGYYYFVWKSLHPLLIEARAKETELLTTLETKARVRGFAKQLE